MEKNVWIVDGAYLFKSAPGRFDYLLLKKELEKQVGGHFMESYYFNSQGNNPAPSQESFNKWLKSAAPLGPKMIVRTYPLKQVTTRCAHCGETNERQVQKGVDVGIVTQLFKLEKRMDRLILCAGDGDFADAVETLASMGKDIILAAFRDTCSPDLQCFANRLVWLDSVWDNIRKERPDESEFAAASNAAVRMR